MVAQRVEPPAVTAGWQIEQTGIESVADADRHGRPSDLFWPWAAANLSFFGIAYGVYIVGLGLGLWQAIVAGIVGAAVSFLLVGLVSLAGQRAGAPTMTLSRAAFGVQGNKLPTLFSYVALVGWETVLVALSTLATGTVLDRLHAGLGGKPTLGVAFAITALVTIAVGVFGHGVIMRVERWFTAAFVLMTIVYFVIMIPKLDLHRASALPSAGAATLLGGSTLAAAGLGLGWVNCGADYSRYLPRRSSARGVVGWTAFGGAVAPIVLITFGVLVTASNPKLAAAAGADPVGALAGPLPTWFLVPYVIIGILGFVAGAMMDIYSSGLNLLTLGVRLPRHLAVLIDGCLMVGGGIYIVFVAPSFFGPFQAFLTVTGVVMAAWVAIFLVDLALFRRDGYDEADLYSSAGVHGAVNPAGVVALVVATVVGLGTVTSGDPHIQKALGFLLTDAAKNGGVGASSVGVLLALLVAGVLYAGLATTVWDPARRSLRRPAPAADPG